jgi:hypothetical protein
MVLRGSKPTYTNAYLLHKWLLLCKYITKLSDQRWLWDRQSPNALPTAAEHAKQPRERALSDRK